MSISIDCRLYWSRVAYLDLATGQRHRKRKNPEAVAETGRGQPPERSGSYGFPPQANHITWWHICLILDLVLLLAADKWVRWEHCFRQRIKRRQGLLVPKKASFYIGSTKLKRQRVPLKEKTSVKLPAVFRFEPFCSREHVIKSSKRTKLMSQLLTPTHSKQQVCVTNSNNNLKITTITSITQQ